MSKSLRSFEDLECWQAATAVRRYVMVVAKKFPPIEKRALLSDLTRAARSATHNIAEGFGRFHYQENIQFCRQSRGSLQEIIDQFITARDEHYISDSEYKEGRELIDKALALLNGYINYLSRAKENHLTNNE